MNAHDVYGFDFAIIFGIIMYFALRRLRFASKTAKIALAIIVPIGLFILVSFLIYAISAPIYFQGVAFLCWIVLAIEMLLIPKVSDKEDDDYL